MRINETKMKVSVILFLLFSGLMFCTAFAQQATIRGTVADSKTGEGIQGVNILVQGTTIGTTTNDQGQYSLSVPSLQDTLVFSFVGFKSKVVPIQGRTEINISLKPQAIVGEELVVIGYGTQEERFLTGSVTSISFDDEQISAIPMTNISSALGGRVSGLTVQQGSGSPGESGATLRVRGVGSLNSSQAPLVLIDGVPGDMNLVNPNDVASISVLKGAAAAAIYGARASNGVILVTTKTGSDTNGEVILNYSGTVGFTKPTKLFDVIDYTPNHMELVNRILNNSGLNPRFTKSEIEMWAQKSKTDPVKYPNTNWWDAILETSVIQTHNISAQGGGENINFYTSFRFRRNNGLIAKTGYTQYNVKANISYAVNDWLDLRANVTGIKSEKGPASISDAFTYFNASTPAVTPVSPDGRYGASMLPGTAQANNIVRWIQTTRGVNKGQAYKGKFNAILSPLKGLEIKGSYYLSMQNNTGWSSRKNVNTWDFQTNSIVKNSASNPLSLSNYYTKNIRRVVNANATYQTNFKKNSFEILAGFNQAYYKMKAFDAYGRDLISLEIPVLDATSTNPQVGGNAYDYARRSFFGRLTYNYNEKYLFSANLRVDGSSRFSPENRWGYFPSFSAGWILSAEPFWEGLENIFNFFKIRGSWGKLGNNGIGNYRWRSVYSSSNYSFGGEPVAGLAAFALTNRDIGWETTKQWNIGLDFSTLKNSLDFTFTYYNKLTEGILAQPPIPLVNGELSPPTINSAKVRNSGINFDVSYTKQIGDFSLAVSVNGAYNKNRIAKYKEGIMEPHGAGVWTEGQPIGIYWLRKVDHIVQDKSEIDKMLSNGWEFSPSSPGPGDFLYKDTNDDKKINADDRVLMGNPIPLYTFGGSVSLGYKGFDLYVSIAGVAEWDKYLHGGFFTTQPRVDGYLYPVKFLNSWTKENKSTTIPKMYVNNPINNMPSEYFLHDASYLRFKTIQFGYTLPISIVEDLGVQNVRVYIDLENYITITSYPGLDPEASGNITYPLMKTLNFGLNIKL